MRLPADYEQSPFVQWRDFIYNFPWKQGEHLSAIGPTGAGKTTLTNNVLHLREFVLFLQTKKKDPTVEWLKRNRGFVVKSDIGELVPEVTPKVILRPQFPNLPARKLADYHAEFFQDALSMVFRVGGWTVVADEVRYLTQNLKLAEDMEILWLQGRSLGVTVVASTQRPAFVPLSLYDAPTHLFFWRDNDEVNLRRIGGLGGINAAAVRYEVATLPHHEILYVNTRQGLRLRTKVEVTA